MTEESHRRRIVVGLEESAQCRSGLETAARLAAKLAVELHGIFVEDPELLHAADLPVTALIGFEGGERRRVDASQMRHSLKIRARTLKGQLERAATAHGLAWRFEMRQGEVARELLAYANPGDILALGASARRLRAIRADDTGTAASVSRTAACSVLISAGPRPGGRVLVFTSGSDEAVAMGLSLAQVTQCALTVQPVGSGLPVTPSGPFSSLQAAGGRLLEPAAGGPDLLEALIRQESPAFIVSDKAAADMLGIDPAETAARYGLAGVLIARAGVAD